MNDGAVGMEDYLRTLDAIGYTGPLTIEREISEDPERQKTEIGNAVSLLTQRVEKSDLPVGNNSSSLEVKLTKYKASTGVD